MAWGRIDDGAHCHAKFLEAGAEATGLFWMAISWCNRYATDGHIPKSKLFFVYPSPNCKHKRAAKTLVDVGLWEDHGDEFVIHDYFEDDRNKSAADIQAERDKWREKKKRQREAGRKAGTRSGKSRGTPRGTGESVPRGHSGDMAGDSPGESRTSHTHTHTTSSLEEVCTRAPAPERALGPAVTRWVDHLLSVQLANQRGVMNAPTAADVWESCGSELNRLYKRNPTALDEACNAMLGSGFRWGRGKPGAALAYLRQVFESLDAVEVPPPQPARVKDPRTEGLGFVSRHRKGAS